MEAHRKAQQAAIRAQLENPGAVAPPAEETAGEYGRDWDEGSEQYQQRQARIAAAREQRERMRDPEPGHWSSDMNRPSGVTSL
jgi:hypothetical protein